jgi:hypothetical protein
MHSPIYQLRKNACVVFWFKFTRKNDIKMFSCHTTSFCQFRSLEPKMFPNVSPAFLWYSNTNQLLFSFISQIKYTWVFLEALVFLREFRVSIRHVCPTPSFIWDRSLLKSTAKKTTHFQLVTTELDSPLLKLTTSSTINLAPSLDEDCL